MNLCDLGQGGERRSIPRVSGGEPMFNICFLSRKKYSPRERG